MDRPRLTVVTALIGMDDRNALMAVGRMARDLSRQSAAARVRTELFVVDWQPPHASPTDRLLQAEFPSHDCFGLTIASLRQEEGQKLPFLNVATMYTPWAQNVGVRRAGGDVIAVVSPMTLFSDALFGRVGREASQTTLLVPPERCLRVGTADELSAANIERLVWRLGDQRISSGAADASASAERTLRHRAARALLESRRRSALRRTAGPEAVDDTTDGAHGAIELAITGGALIASRELWMELRGLPEVLAIDRGFSRVFSLQAAAFGFATRPLPFRHHVWSVRAHDTGTMHVATEPYGRVPLRLSFMPKDVACFAEVHVESLAATVDKALKRRRSRRFFLNGPDWGGAHSEPAIFRRGPTGMAAKSDGFGSTDGGARVELAR